MKNDEQKLKEISEFVVEEKDRFLKEYLKDVKSLQKECFYFLGKGKSIRTILTGLCAYEIGLSIRAIIPLACAIELIHLYTIIHDDLPAMDNATERRGKQALHLAFGESNAILTGDLLQNRAYHLLTTHYSRKKELIDLFFFLTGEKGLIRGQVYDIKNKLTPLSLRELIEIYKLKTGSLFQLALGGPAIIKNLAKEKITLFKKIGCLFGIIYQIKDDIEDEKDTLEPNIVKSVGIEKAKITLEGYKKELFKLASSFHFLNRFFGVLFSDAANN
ncbi:MAG: polyprenyl synthetase family protein [Planctomycetota bacterium]